jgi:hypothetical protein
MSRTTAMHQINGARSGVVTFGDDPRDDPLSMTASRRPSGLLSDVVLYS